MAAIYVIIATIKDRADWLINRSLYSVYEQKDIEKTRVQVVVIDDSNDENADLISTKIYDDVKALRGRLGLAESEFKTIILPNQRTRNHSGTGAWNTGIFYAFQNDQECFVSILDDDDEYQPFHLSNCCHEIDANPMLLGVFQQLKWQFEDGAELCFPMLVDDLNPTSFFLGNPGVQGSNMFIKAQLMVDIGGFDEGLRSTTDRDLMIRLLRYLEAKSWSIDQMLKVLNTPGVIHHAHGRFSVTTHLTNKHAGLDRFYEKYRNSFSEEEYLRSLKRASFLFQYERQYA